MTIHFAAAVSRRPRTRLTPIELRAALRTPANDNLASGERDAVHHAALRQFTRHGICAAEHARQQAERAFFKGDRDTYQWWLGICRELDRKLTSNPVECTLIESEANPR
jgi:hypothetical protein